MFYNPFLVKQVENKMIVILSLVPCTETNDHGVFAFEKFHLFHSIGLD